MVCSACPAAGGSVFHREWEFYPLRVNQDPGSRPRWTASNGLDVAIGTLKGKTTRYFNFSNRAGARVLGGSGAALWGIGYQRERVERSDGPSASDRSYLPWCPEEWEKSGHSLHEIIPDETGISASERLEQKELTELIAERIKELPEVPKRVLAMYYYDGMKLADIALVFGLTESRICQIHTQAVSQLRTYVPACSPKSSGFYGQQGNWITASSRAAMGIWGSQESILHSAIAEFAILRGPIVACQPFRCRSRLKIVIMFMAFRSITAYEVSFSAIISLNTFLKVKNLNFS
jgi:RNA polymerase sigma factor (sigma-70 family)